MVGIPKVDLREHGRASKAIEKLVNERQGVSVLDGDGIQASVVNAEA
jgi:hypothetical protein